MAAIATFALKAGVWFRRGRLLIVSPDSLGTACPLSGRNSTYRPVQILEASSMIPCLRLFTVLEGLILVGAPAAAHSHVWVVLRTQIVYDKAGLVPGVRHVLTFVAIH